MKCPLCKCRGHIKIDLHADGFSQDARECDACGGIWTFSGKGLKIIKASDQKQEKTFSDFICPTCKSIVCIGTDLNAYQFHEELQECGSCGTVCSTAHNLVEVVNDSQVGSFLSSTPELVEADDYIFA